MLLEKETEEKFGYNPLTLSNGSSKKVCLRCDYCDVIIEQTNKNRYKSHKYIRKDACKSCRYKKRADVELVRFGHKNSACREDVREKISQNQTSNVEKYKKTCLEKYGVENAMQDDSVKENLQNSIRAKYDVNNISQLDGIRQKSSECMKSKETQDKLFQGIIDKYGVDNAFKSKEVKDKIRQTCLEKYGVEHHLQNQGILNKQEKTLIERYGVSNASQIDIEKHNGKTRKEWSEELDKSYTTFCHQVNKYGFDEAIQIPKYINGLEYKFKMWLDELDVDYEGYKVIEKRKTDFVLEDKIVIELDGLFWHSDAILKDDYHVIKRQHYIDNDYIPLFFRSDEIENKFEIVKSIILNKLGRTNKVGARKCYVVEITADFFSENHLMGKGAGKCVGLEYNGEIVAGIQMKNTKNGAEISRFCLAKNYSVAGGFSRLLKHHPLFSPANKIITFIDLRYGRGDYLTKLDFKLKSCYPSFRWTNGNQSFHRMKFPGNTGYDSKMYKIWDCGQAKYVMEK